MINALYIVKFADGVSAEQKTAMADAARKLCESVSEVGICEVVPDDSPTNPGDLFCEMAFRERPDYDSASSTGAWDELKATVSEEELAADVTFVAYGPGDANLGKGECTCHRVMLMHLVDGVAPEVIDMMRRRVLKVGEYVPGLVSTQISEVFESSGSVDWNYVYDCDFDTPATFLGKYMTSPYHWGYLRLVQSDCVECVADMQLTPYVVTEKAFLTSLSD